MTYHAVASVTQVVSLLIFIGMFLAVLAYALWPSNGPVFDKIQRAALDLDEGKSAPNAKDDRGNK